MIGDRIGQYLVERELATGGFGEVYAGRAESGERVAIKVLLAEHVGSHAVERFALEVAIVRRLAHPGIVDVVATGTTPDGRPYCVMPLLEGRDLASVLTTDGPLGVERAVAIIASIGEALAVAHAAGIIHRDVKPRNVFLCDDGRVVLLDFGIAKLVDDDARLTMSRQTIGSLGAMAPEQLTAGAVDARTDVYALGVLAYHALCGSPPFAGDGAAQLHRFARRPRPSALGAPAAFDPVITRAMAIRPAERHASVAEFVDAMRAAAGTLARARTRAIGVHVDGLAAPEALRAANERLAGAGFRPLARAAACSAWWRTTDAADVAATLQAIGELGLGLLVAVHVGELDTDGGQASGGPLPELWRWVPRVPTTPLHVTDAARDILGAS